MSNLITMTQSPTSMENLLCAMNNLMSTNSKSSSNMGIVEEESSFSQLGAGKILKKDLIKIAKKNNVNLKTRDGKMKTKEQLLKSLKRKKLI